MLTDDLSKKIEELKALEKRSKEPAANGIEEAWHNEEFQMALCLAWPEIRAALEHNQKFQVDLSNLLIRAGIITGHADDLLLVVKAALERGREVEEQLRFICASTDTQFWSAARKVLERIDAVRAEQKNGETENTIKGYIHIKIYEVTLTTARASMQFLDANKEVIHFNTEKCGKLPWKIPRIDCIVPILVGSPEDESILS